MEGRDARMIHRSKKPRLALEPRHAFLVLRERFREDFDRDLAAELGVPGTINFAHTARTDGREDLVLRQPGSGSQLHAWPLEGWYFAPAEESREVSKKADNDYGGPRTRIGPVPPSTNQDGLVLEELPEIAGDAVRLEQMLENLASNAIKYTPAGGKIEVTFKRGGDKDRPITIVVQDTGIGIPPEEQHLLFSEFFRAANAREVEEIGTGLGLAIVKHIVDLHQGRIRVQSREGSGTTFTIDLPAYLPR